MPVSSFIPSTGRILLFNLYKCAQNFISYEEFLIEKSSSKNPANLSVFHQHKDHQHHRYMQKKLQHEQYISAHKRRQQVMISKMHFDKNDEKKPKGTIFSSP